MILLCRTCSTNPRIYASEGFSIFSRDSGAQHHFSCFLYTGCWICWTNRKTSGFLRSKCSWGGSIYPKLSLNFMDIYPMGI